MKNDSHSCIVTVAQNLGSMNSAFSTLLKVRFDRYVIALKPNPNPNPHLTTYLKDIARYKVRYSP